MESNFNKPSTGKKGGKGSIVENITVDEKNAAKVAEAKRESKEQSKEIEEK